MPHEIVIDKPARDSPIDMGTLETATFYKPIT